MNSSLFGFLDCFQEQKTPGPGQYLGEDGLIYCEKCRTPVQCRVKFEDRIRIMPCICRCQQEEGERQKKRMEKQEQMLYVRRLKAAGLQERYLRECTF